MLVDQQSTAAALFHPLLDKAVVQLDIQAEGCRHCRPEGRGQGQPEAELGSRGQEQPEAESGKQ
jgi:hypothetical protein